MSRWSSSKMMSPMFPCYGWKELEWKYKLSFLSYEEGKRRKKKREGYGEWKKMWKRKWRMVKEKKRESERKRLENVEKERKRKEAEEGERLSGEKVNICNCIKSLRWIRVVVTGKNTGYAFSNVRTFFSLSLSPSETERGHLERGWEREREFCARLSGLGHFFPKQMLQCQQTEQCPRAAACSSSSSSSGRRRRRRSSRSKSRSKKQKEAALSAAVLLSHVGLLLRTSDAKIWTGNL